MEKIVKNGLKKCYISGPMTGLEDLNKIEFEEAKKRLSYFGFEAINPHNIHSKEFEDNIKRRLELKEIDNDDAWKMYLKKDIESLMRCEFICVLKNWEQSRGARFEVINAIVVGMPIFCAHTLKELSENECAKSMQSITGDIILM